jgi:hypothetical protein
MESVPGWSPPGAADQNPSCGFAVPVPIRLLNAIEGPSSPNWTLPPRSSRADAVVDVSFSLSVVTALARSSTRSFGSERTSVM